MDITRWMGVDTPTLSVRFSTSCSLHKSNLIRFKKFIINRRFGLAKHLGVAFRRKPLTMGSLLL